ncbi:ABC1 kinase family protein [Sphingomicrobium astaxanthinifaciens]|uniref:ABC1 kinase family protein n=1 Tax=Sphingomicrobium astaxanthinifaciens TaxID=1227949 RepID=UPI001FCBA0B9|nr:AarF/ABC1/UbiB kinase family protein [Sphingomicrobium astaxanthinifaciens]MCJ7421431.1 AarF/ABC1/UbiB kinase family protein [Sphingomicrobium astaxanthinifaciens]
MADPDDDPRERAVPAGRAARVGQFTRLGLGVVGGMVGEGARRLARGEGLRARDLMLTPGNIARVTERLSHLRGAAMKLGQMISMDAGDLLPPELAAILGRLREQAHRMPPQQLNQLLKAEWGPDWRRRFKRFEPTPMAAASIGQVHRATLPDGRALAVKIQYPGVAQSIDSDVDNVATLLRVSGLLPKALDIAPLLEAAKAQLAEEADYEREGAQLEAYKARLADDPRYVVPGLVPELTTPNILAMDFVEGVGIETLREAPQALRDRVMGELIELVLRELFEFGVMQTDPNFANYRFQPESGRLVLLDFGAARPVDPAIADSYARILAAIRAGGRDAVREASVAAGFVSPIAADRHRALIDGMIDVIVTEFARPGPFDFGDRGFVAGLREQGIRIAEDREAWHLPPAGTIFVQRKISGTALLAANLKARVEIRPLIDAALHERAV